MDLLLSNVETVPRAEYAAHLERAQEAVRGVDPDDAPFVALAMAQACPLWTQDKALLGVEGIETISTHEIATWLRGE